MCFKKNFKLKTVSSNLKYSVWSLNSDFEMLHSRFSECQLNSKFKFKTINKILSLNSQIWGMRLKL